METLKLTRIGENSNGEIVYKDENSGKFYLDINHDTKEVPTTLYTCSPADDMDGEAGCPVKQKFEIVNPFTERELREKEFEFEYMMLSRITQDIQAYIGKTGDATQDKWDCRYKNEKQIWGQSIRKCLDKAKELWQKIPEDIKPQWITWEQILQFEQKLF